MGHPKNKNFNRKSSKQRELILLYSKPFIKKLPALVATNDKRYIPSGKSAATKDCSHEYCLAERTRAFMDSDDNPKPIGLPWASGNLKYLPGHKKIVFPLRKEKKATRKTKKTVSPSTETVPEEPEDKITNPEICGVIDETLYAYKVFMLAGMIISEAKKITGNAEDEKEDSDDSDSDDIS